MPVDAAKCERCGATKILALGSGASLRTFQSMSQFTSWRLGQLGKVNPDLDKAPDYRCLTCSDAPAATRTQAKPVANGPSSLVPPVPEVPLNIKRSQTAMPVGVQAAAPAHLTKGEFLAERNGLGPRRDPGPAPHLQLPPAPGLAGTVWAAVGGVLAGAASQATTMAVWFCIGLLSLAATLGYRWSQARRVWKGEVTKLKRAHEEAERRYRALVDDCVVHNSRRDEAIERLLQTQQVPAILYDRARLNHLRRWTTQQRDSLYAAISSTGLRPKREDEIEQSRHEGFVTEYEDALATALSAYLPLAQQVWTPARYPADILALDPRRGELWVIEVDGSIHDTGDGRIKDRERELTLLEAGLHVLRVENATVSRDADGCAQRIAVEILGLDVSLPNSIFPHVRRAASRAASSNFGSAGVESLCA